MGAKINPMIIDKFTGLDRSVRVFLIELILNELDHSDEPRWRFGQVYEDLIEKYSQNYSSDQENT